MNNTQKVWLWVGVVIIVVMILNPPYNKAMGNDKIFYEFSGYYSLFSPPEPVVLMSIDSTRLALQILVVIIICGAIIATNRDKKK